ncbi:MAG: DNA gyrase subunit A, partial [Halobacteriales archaeon]
EDEMEQSYIDYAMSVIAGRALPSAKDGLKPVHRRILYAMHEAGITSGSGHRKSSSIVGETMGNYHPHGDQAIYDALVRMAQPFAMRYPLIDGQGNFGSLDDDPPAAMRYTEARMAPIAEELLEDIEKDTVDFVPNYDDRLEEPEVLPAGVPNLLVNGSSGIAVGMSTNIPPHNLGEIVDATVALIGDPQLTVADLMEHVQGPDFPTGANIVGFESVREAYETGRARLTVRAEYEVEEREGANDRIVITEVPYQTNKARLVERIADDVNEGRIEGVTDLRDESDRTGVRVVVEVSRGAVTDVVENRLLEHHLERTFSYICLALVDGQPRVLNLKEALEAYVDHRLEVVRRRSEYDLGEAEDRAHILEGRLRALDRVDDVIEAIRESDDRAAAIAVLQADFAFSEAQAEHVVRMQLGSLTSLEVEEVEAEYEAVTAEIERLEAILADESALRAVVVEELEAMKAGYADERRTRIIEGGPRRMHADLIPERDVLVVLTRDGYVKRMDADGFDPQRRGGKGIIGADVKEDDRICVLRRVSSHDRLLCFTDAGKVHERTAFELPDMGRTARGRSAVNLFALDDDECITHVVAASDLEADGYVTLVTRDGYVKRLEASAFENVLSTGIIATDLEAGDEVVDAVVTNGSMDLVVFTADGMAIRFDEDDVRPMGRTARGVRAVQLAEGAAVVAVEAAEPDADVDALTVTDRGFGKRTPLGEYRRQSRYGKGLMDIKTGGRNGEVADAALVAPGDEVVLLTERGQIMRTWADEISRSGRNTMGVTVMRVDPDDRLAAVAVFPPAPAADD